jgi:hypothetical protein
MLRKSSAERFYGQANRQNGTSHKTASADLWTPAPIQMQLTIIEKFG